MITDKVLNNLIDKYEKSKTFSSINKVNQSFSVKIDKVIKEYSDDSKFELFKDVNDELERLEKKGFIERVISHSDVVDSVSLNVDKLDEIYKYLKRRPRKDNQARLIEILDKYISNEESPLQSYISEQINRIEDNKNVEHFKDSFKDFEDMLKATQAVLENDKETYVRDLSVLLFGDSKRFEALQSSICSILTKYGDSEDSDNVLLEYDVVKTPTYVCVKGNGVVTLKNQSIDLSMLSGDLAFSTETLKEITDIKVMGDTVITIENLTSFHDYQNKDHFVIYLGGFHNKVKRDFIKKVYDNNKNIKYLHFGDIDAGGFYILNHLRNKTGVNFSPYLMDIQTLKDYKDCWKVLTNEDVNRLNKLRSNPELSSLVDFMLENNCKLEQENITSKLKL